MLRWRAKASDKDYRDGYKVYVSEKGTDVDDFDRQSPLFSTSKENHEWTTHEISLAGCKGKSVYIAFVNDSKDKACLYVDDLFIGVPSSVKIALDLDRVITQYGDISISGEATNISDKTIENYKIGFCADGKTHEQTFNQPIEAGRNATFTLDDKLTVLRNRTVSYTAWIKAGNDSTGIQGKVSAYPWKQVSEEVTGTWCGYCVRGIVAMKTMREKYPDSFIGIAIHNSTSSWTDAMAAGVEDYHDALYSNCKISGYPHSVFNRNVMYSIDPGYMEAAYNSIVNTYTNNCGVQLSGHYDAAQNEISAQTDVYFAENMDNADYRLAYVVIENNVHRTHEDLGIEKGKATGYEQNNYYADNAMGEMGGFENLPSTVPAEQMWYNDVARGIYPDYYGEPGIIPGSIVEGECYSHRTTIEMPDNVIYTDNAELIVLLIDKNGIIVNADKIALGSGTTGITQAVNVGNRNQDDAYYTVGGIRFDRPYKGLYIHKGRVTVVK